MASCSTYYAPNSNIQKLVALDSSNDGVSGVKRRTIETKRSSFLGQLNNSQKKKGKAIISGAGDFDEITGGKVATPKNLGAEISHMVGLSETEAVEMDRVRATSIECGCCYWEYPVENMVQCRNGHRFCFKCITKRIDEIIYGGLKLHASLSCMTIDCCEESIPLLEISRARPNDVIERYEYRQAQEAIVEAKIEGLVYCPICNIPYEVDKCVQVLDCSNPKCFKASCIQCKKLSHLPLRCEEVEKNSETALRREVEERMTKAVIRECNICQAELIKTYGCNKVRCVCGNTMCYICRRTISYLDHFCGCLTYGGEPGKPCRKCNRCSLTENEIEDNEAFAAREEALTELVDQRPELLHQEIGPPLKYLPHIAIPAPDDQVENMAIPPPLSPPPVDFFRFGDQPANMAVPVQLPPQHLFRFGNGDHLANRTVSGNGDQLGNMVVPPSFGNGDQLANMYLQAHHANVAIHPPLPSPEFFRPHDNGNGDQLANRAVSGNGNQLANMYLQAQHVRNLHARRSRR